jgi:phage gp29-like protein
VVHPVYGGDRLYPQDETLIHEGGRGFLAYDIYTEIAKDCHAYAVLQKRFMAVVGREWEVLPGQRRGSSSTRQEKKAADMLKAQLEGLSVRSEVVEDRETTLTTAGNFDEVCWNLLWAIHYGWQPAELIWDQDGSEAFVSEAIAKDLRRFVMVVGQRGFKLRMLDITGNLIEGVPLPHRKFIVHRFASVPTEDPYGLGLGTRLFYPTFFKRQDIKFWLQFADKFASPTAVAKYPRGSTDADKKEYLAMLDAIATDAGIAIPADVIVEFLESERASALNTYKDLAAFCDGEISKAVLGETGTTDQQGSGGSRARDQVGDGVRIEVAKADADLLSATLNRSLCRWVSELNLGPDVAPPMIWRKFPELTEKEDLNARATRDNTIASASGRTITEKYWVDTYGVAFEPKEPAQDPNAPPDLSGAFGPPPGAAPDTTAPPDATTPPADAAALDAPPALNLEEQLCKPCTVEHPGDAAESSTAWTVGDAPAGDIADFARLKMAGNTKQKKNCTKGWSCGYTCLGQDKKTCKSPLQGQVAKYADWLQQQAGGASLPSQSAAAPQNSLATIPASSIPPARSPYDDPDLTQMDNPSDKDVEEYLAKKKAEFKKISDDDIKALTLRSALTAAGTDDPEEAYAYYGRKIAETWTDGIQEKQNQISALDLKIAKTKSPNQSAKFQKQKSALEKSIADDNQWIAENLSTPSQLSDRGKSYVEADEVSIKRLITQSDKTKALYAYAVIKSGAESASDVTNRIAHIEEPKQAAFESIKLAMSGESGNDAKILGLPKSGLTPAAVKAAYKKAAQAAHPDSGGSAEAFYKVNTAYQNLKKQLSFSDSDDPEIVTLNEYAQSIGVWSLEEKPSEPAETPAVETTTQQLTQSAIAQSQQPVEDWFEKVRGLLEGAASLEEVRDRLY